jgi:transcriptional regulator with XRE-family HTH domain
MQRIAAGLTQAELGARAGLGAKYVSEIERGTRDVPLSTLHALVADGLGLELDIRFRTGKARPADRALPRAIAEVARTVAELPDAARGEVLAIVRAALRLARR